MQTMGQLLALILHLNLLPKFIMAKYATGKYAKAISDRSGLSFPIQRWLESGMDL